MSSLHAQPLGSSQPEFSPDDEIRLFSHHRPGLEAGDYDLRLEQKVFLDGDTSGKADQTREARRNITVLGDRFSLPPDRVHAVFPPDGSRGDDWQAFPHIILNRSTLPWERSACDHLHERRPPWLALLLFDPEEADSIEESVVTLGDLEPASTDRRQLWPGVQHESAQHRTDKVQVVDVPWRSIRHQLPASRVDLELRTHVRRVVAPQLLFSIHAAPGPIAELVDDLAQGRVSGRVAQAFALNGVDLAGPSIRHVVHGPGNVWFLDDAEAGAFEIRAGDYHDGRWLSIEGGPIPTTGPAPDQAPIRFMVHDGPRDFVAALDSDTMPPSLSRLLASREIQLGHPDVATEETSTRWRVHDPSGGMHHILHVGPNASLEVLDYSGAGTELAVVIGNRLPAPGTRSVVHLVSLEDRYHVVNDTECAFTTGVGGDDEAPPVGDTDRFRFVSLKRWDFFCEDSGRTFSGLLEGLNGGVDRGNSQIGIGVDDLATPHDEPSAEVRDRVVERLHAGYAALRHRMRQGDRTVSWYRGPLGTAGHAAPLIPNLLPAGTADELVLFDDNTGLFDMSFAAAWELGRLLMLADTPTALNLFNWKRSQVHDQAAVRHVADFGFQLPVGHGRAPRSSVGETAFPLVLEAWFRELALLRRIPFNYLIPDERMLPPESMRFFSLDPEWLECVRDGAFSIGRTLRSDAGRDRDHRAKLPPIEPVSGVLIRSEVVSSYPGLVATAYDVAASATSADVEASHLDPATYPQLECLRRDDLSPSVLLMLWRGDIRMLDLHLRPETLHFGLDLPDPADMRRPGVAEGLHHRDPRVLGKSVRRADGQKVHHAVRPALFADEESAEAPPAPSVPLAEGRTVPFPALAGAMHTALGAQQPDAHHDDGTLVDPGVMSSAVFGLEMVAAVELFRFLRSPSKGSTS